MGRYILTEQFTSRDGKMEVDPREYGMTQHGLDVVGDKKNELGGATQIFARIDGGPSKNIKFFSHDTKYNFVKEPKPESGWSVFDMTHDNAGYNPEKGEIGWWNVIVDGAESDVAENIGLPHSWHVSTFLVFTWGDSATGDGDSGPDVPPVVTPPPTGKTISAYLYTDGTWEKA